MGKVEFNLADCAANIVCVMMFGFTIAGCFPTVYPLLAVFLAVCHVTHRRFMRFYCKKTPYSADKIIEASLKFVYFGIIMHFGVVFIGSTERSNIVLILWACCVGLYLLRFIILKNCIIIVHKLGGTWSTE